MKRDGVTDKKIVQLLAPAARDADANADLDLAAYGYPGKVTICFAFGAEGITLSGTDKIEAKLRHGASATPTTAVAATDVVFPADAVAAIQPGVSTTGLIAIADGNADIPGVFSVGYVGSSRYVNALLDFSGTHGAATPTAVWAILEDLPNTPA